MSLVKRDTFKLPAQVMNGSMMNPGNIKEEWVILSLERLFLQEMQRTRDRHRNTFEDNGLKLEMSEGYSCFTKRLKFSLLSICSWADTARISVLKVHTSWWWLNTDGSPIFIHTCLLQEKMQFVNAICLGEKKMLGISWQRKFWDSIERHYTKMSWFLNSSERTYFSFTSKVLCNTAFHYYYNVLRIWNYFETKTMSEALKTIIAFYEVLKDAF